MVTAETCSRWRTGVLRSSAFLLFNGLEFAMGTGIVPVDIVADR